MERREYEINITVNGIKINKVIIDPHYEEKHVESMSDELILDLVKTLNGEFHAPQDASPPYKYFVKDGIPVNGKLYKLIWLHEDHQIYVGVINAFRR